MIEKAIVTCALISLFSLAAGADVRVPKVFGDSMVLQRDMLVPVWGWAAPGETVLVRIGDSQATAVAGDDGRWAVKLGPLPAGGPLELTVKGGNTLTFKNVLVGEVWVCSGQSNMEFTVSGARDAAQEVAGADYPRIRHFAVGKRVSERLLDDVSGRWVECSPQTVGAFTAVGYFFARHLYKTLDVPIGLIHTSWGGTPAESWTSMETLRADADFAPLVQRYEASLADDPEAQVRYRKALEEWEKVAYFEDPGNKGYEQGWADPGHDAADWQEMVLPTFWENVGLSIDGVVWFRKEVAIPDGWAGRELALSLGSIDDTDTTYFNGVKVGETTVETPTWWQAPRRYTVPGELVRAGRAVIAVRVYDRWMNGGFGGVPADMTLAPTGSAGAPIALAGPWRYKVEVSREQPKTVPPQPPAPMGADNPWLPSGLYNAMICPLVPYGIKGAIWYQGESNGDRAYQYRKLFPAMVQDWRGAWGQADFPFLFVQLANYLGVQQQPSEDDPWPELREAQLMALALPNTGMAVAIDVGEANDVHPKNKQAVGYRLALAALGVAYGKDIAYSGPLYDHMEVRGSRAIVTLKHVGGGLVAAGSKALKGFAVAGSDRKFAWADAEIRGDSVAVSSREVRRPVAVRYGWANNPIGDLYNAEGLPASPFRTDDWPGVTINNR